MVQIICWNTVAKHKEKIKTSIFRNMITKAMIHMQMNIFI